MMIDRQKFRVALVERRIVLDASTFHLLVARVEQLLLDERDAALPGRIHDFLGRPGTPLGDANRDAWLEGRKAAEAYIQRLIKRPKEPPLPLPPLVADLDPLCSVIGDLLDLPKDADGQYIVALANACRSGPAAIEESGIKRLKILKAKKGRKRRDERWRIIAGGVYQFFNSDGSTDVDRAEHPDSDRNVRQVIRALCEILNISVKDSSVSVYLTDLKNGIKTKNSIPGQVDYRPVRNGEINEKLIDVDQLFKTG